MLHVVTSGSVSTCPVTGGTNRKGARGKGAGCLTAPGQEVCEAGKEEQEGRQ